MFHPDIRSHIGGCIELGKEALKCTSQKQNISTKRSTEEELVLIYYPMSQILWAWYFLKSQGITPNYKITYQENQSAIRMTAGRKSSSGKIY